MPDITAFITTHFKLQMRNMIASLMHIGPHTYTLCKILEIESILFYKLSEAYLWFELHKSS